jgi:hypothetical protein
LSVNRGLAESLVVELLPQERNVVFVENDFLDFLLRQDARKEVSVRRIGICVLTLSVSDHLFLQVEEVEHSVEHRHACSSCLCRRIDFFLVPENALLFGSLRDVG